MPKFIGLPTVREAKLYKRLGREKVQCGLCERRCTILEGKKGWCGTRANIEGRLYTLVYGDINAIERRPIEIKPFFHYWPGSYSLTYSTWSCNFYCLWCQNWHLSKFPPNPEKANYIPSEKIVERALGENCKGICVSFTEPTLLHEYNLDVFSLARKKNLYCTYVSNGYMSVDALRQLREAGLDGLKIDAKGDPEVYAKYCSVPKGEVIWRNIREAKKLGLHLEIVNLVVTGVNDNEEQIRWLIEQHLKYAGPDVPLHFTRYYPAFKFKNPETKVEILEWARETARKMGVLYPYVGNVPGHKYENTYCPKCGEVLIKRFSTSILEYNIKKGRCKKCGEEIPIKGEYIA